MTSRNFIMITGAPRSGTSLTANVLNACGAWGGEMFPGNQDNPRGFFENKELRQGVVKPYLKRNGWDEYGQFPLPPRIVEPVDEWSWLVMDIVKEQGYRDGLWFYKCAKAILMWQVWEDAFPAMNWVIVRRDPYHIAQSCLHTRFMRRYNTLGDWLEYVHEHETRFELLKATAQGRVFEVWPNNLVHGESGEYRSLIEELGLVWSAEAVEGLIIKEAWHG